jgi:large subunit ribosomal protein L6
VSRIGKAPIEIPSGVEIKVSDANLVTVKGPLGQLEEQISKDMSIKIEGSQVSVERPTNNKLHRSLHGLSRTLISNMVTGVTKGYEKALEIQGVGYRATKKGKVLDLQLGHSHPIEMEDPAGISVEVPTNTSIIVKGIDKALVGNYAAKIRNWRKPEPYKGKGVRYVGEYVRRKEGKAGK